MIGNLITNSTNMLERGLDASWLRQETILNNVANVDTPGFKSSGVSFEERFASAVKGQTFVGRRTRAQHIEIGESAGGVKPLVVRTNDAALRADGNNVDIEGEMTNLAKNGIYYSSMISKVSSQFSRLRTAISGR